MQIIINEITKQRCCSDPLHEQTSHVMVWGLPWVRPRQGPAFMSSFGSSPGSGPDRAQPSRHLMGVPLGPAQMGPSLLHIMIWGFSGPGPDRAYLLHIMVWGLLWVQFRRGPAFSMSWFGGSPGSGPDSLLQTQLSMLHLLKMMHQMSLVFCLWYSVVRLMYYC